MPTSRWPRVGCPFVPALLRREWSTEPLPRQVAAGSGLPARSTYGDLDDTIWHQLQDHRPLAAHIRDLVAQRIARQPSSDLANRPVLTLAWPEGLDAGQVPFARRTRNVLARLGHVDDVAWMLQVTPSELMAPLYSGPVTLLDFATVVEGVAAADVDGQIVTRAEARRLVEELRAEYPIDKIPCDDPRLDLPIEGGTVGAALDGHGPTGALTVYGLLGAVRAVRAALDRISISNGRDALRDLASAVLRNPNTDAVVRRLGWDGAGGCTRREAAAAAGVSQQRIEQLEQRLRKGIRGRFWFLPVDAKVLIATSRGFSSPPFRAQQPDLRGFARNTLAEASDIADFGPQLSSYVANSYRSAWGADRDLREFNAGDDFWCLFDSTDSGRTELDEPAPRLLAAWGFSRPRSGSGDRRTLRKFPLPPAELGLFDRGHVIAMSLGAGDYVNLVPQDPDLNRGRSASGKRWRALERRLVSDPGVFVFVAMWYADLTDVPDKFDYVVVSTGGELTIESFSNRGPSGEQS